MDTQTLQLNGHTVATVVIDSFAEDPRTVNLEGDLAEGYGIFDLKYPTGDAPYAAPSWYRVYWELNENYGSDRAFRAMRILRSMGVEIPAYLGIRHYQGATQSEWADFLISGPDEARAESYYQSFAAWARGEVFGIQIERKCPVTGDWFTPDHEQTLYGIYLTGSKDFEDEIRSIAEFNWSLETEPISAAGRRAQERAELDVEISAKLETFYAMVTAQGETPLTKLAKELFLLYSELGEEYSLEIEALQ